MVRFAVPFGPVMVIVPGLNDEEVLEESLTDLWNMGSAVLSAAVVPVGLTQFFGAIGLFSRVAVVIAVPLIAVAVGLVAPRFSRSHRSALACRYI